MKYTIIKELIPSFEEKLQKFQRKFNKFSKDILTYSKSEPYLAERVSAYGQKYQVKVVDIEVEGHYQVNGYEFIASLEFMPEIGKNLVKKAPNTGDIPEIYLTRNECDHCGVKRFRKNTVLLKNTKTGEFVQVGKSCVKDYLGVDIEASAGYFSIWDNIDEYLEELEKKSSGTRIEQFFKLDDILEQTVAQKNACGYISKAMVTKWYQENSTGEDIDYYLECPFKTTSSIVWDIITEMKDFNTGKLLYARHPVTDEIKAEVKVIKEFIANAEINDYTHNLKVFIEIQNIPQKEIGLAASMVGYYIRETKKEEDRKIREEIPESEKSQFVGEVGDRITVKGQLECVFSTETEYGMYYIYNFTVGKDNFVWKTSKSMRTDIDLELTGTVKAHNIFRDIKQTELTRVRTKIA